MYIEHGLYAKYVIGKYIEDIKNSMSNKDKLNYWLYIKAGNGFILGKKYGGMVYMSERFKSMGMQ